MAYRGLVYLLVLNVAVISFSVLDGNTRAEAQTRVATTTLLLSICGDSIVNAGEECDIPGETGAYSTTIAGRQCDDVSCQYGPYCGDAILQTTFGEECDDGNNTSGDFCAADCTEEEADAGGGSSGGGGSSSSGGDRSEPGDTEVSVEGKAYPTVTVNILIDGDQVGTVRTNSQGEFLFKTDTDPGTASLSFWANDNNGVRSSTFNTTFDITLGAVTNVTGILIPPTISADDTTVNPGDLIRLSGQTVPNVDVEVSIDNDAIVLETQSDGSGNWSVDFDTSRVSADTHTAKVRYIEGTSTLRTESSFSNALSLFVGVEGQAVSNADLNRDGLINLIDFSILVFWWGTPGGNSDPPADINQNGNTGLEDFSILLFNWTG